MIPNFIERRDKLKERLKQKYGKVKKVGVHGAYNRT